MNEANSEELKAESRRYMTTDEVMALFHVVRKTVYRWNDSGKLHGIKAGHKLLFERDEVEALLTGEPNPKSVNCE